MKPKAEIKEEPKKSEVVIRSERFDIAYKKIADLQPAKYNPRKISDAEVTRLRNSIKEFGFVDPVIVNSDMTIIGGHQRVKAASMEGYEDVPCIVLTIDKRKERVLNLALNKISGDWEGEMLAALLTELEKSERELAGFSPTEVSKVLDRYMNPKEDDYNAEPPKNPKARKGDVYELGRHRLMCGDSTVLGQVEVLMGGEKAKMVFTDPPYNVNYSGRGKKTKRTIENDNMDRPAFLEFLKSTFHCMAKASEENAPAYVCYASRTHREFEDALNATGYLVRNQIIWVKKVASMGWGDYRWKHEPILYCAREDAKLTFYGDRSEYTVWDHEPTPEELLKAVERLVKREEEGISTVWRLGRDSNYEHPTQKPVKLAAIAIMNSSAMGESVLDLFGGGGTTLIAAEQLDRKAYVMEYDPGFIDVIVRRWEKFTGSRAVLIENVLGEREKDELG